MTTGDFVKKMGERGFEPQRSAFLMPTASGPCRFGQYHQAQKIIFDRLGYGDVPIVSPDVRDSYGTSVGLDLQFRRLAWQGIVAVDLLLQLAADCRPYELTAGTVDRLLDQYLAGLTGAVGAGGKGLLDLTREMRKSFARLPLSSVDHKPLIGIVGEIFLRSNPHCNAQIVKRIERLGGRTYTAPISEWFYYTNLGYIYESYMRRSLRSLALALLADSVQRLDEWRLGHRQPSALRLIRRAAPYLHYTFKGEAVLTLGKAVDLIEQGSAGIVNILPFTCMPGTVVAAAVRRLKERYPGLPWLDLTIDGSEGVNLETQLEAFMHQAASYNASAPRCRR